MHLSSRSVTVTPDFTALARASSDPRAFLDGREHYRLLAWLSMNVRGHIIDIGTHRGDSALALSLGGREVHSFDVENRAHRPLRENEERYIADVVTNPDGNHRHLLLTSSLIFLDIDPHEGRREFDFLAWLRHNNYKGIIVLDDIWYFKGMRDHCWYQIEPEFKVDATSIGHWSGTGIVCFDPSRLPTVDGVKENSNWTLVTGYFDLTTKWDANDAIKARPASHYLDEHGQSTLALPNNLVVFCDPDLEQKVWSLRPHFLHDKTRVVPYDFEKFPLTQFRSQIVGNRGGKSYCSRDPRNTASYYLFCMARYAMLDMAMARNEFFYSSHFAWINICIERMGYENLIHLQESLNLDREKFSTCWIDYVAESTVENLEGYFGSGGCKNCAAGCTMCSGFFTGSARYMRSVCYEIEAAFINCLNAGYGHADEQLFPIVYYKHPELFDWYIGDYHEMITNYAGVYSHPEKPLRNLIQHALQASDLAVAKRAIKILADSVASGKCGLDAGTEHQLKQATEMASK